MSWREIVITERCKLDLNMGYMVIRGLETQRIFIDEIAILLIENPGVSMTGALLLSLTEHKVRIVFCDSKRTPYAELEPYYPSHDSSKKLKMQIDWSEEVKKTVWTSIIFEKISNQSKLLNRIGKEKEYLMLQEYLLQIELGDATNREGHAAKVYFNALFGKGFSRRDDKNSINALLNYGYSLILSAFNREVAINGYTTKIGVFHDNVFNHYNLSSDIMEPFRPLIDEKVIGFKCDALTSEIKHKMVGCLNDYIMINGTKQTVLYAIKIYAKSVFDALNNYNVALIKFPDI